MRKFVNLFCILNTVYGSIIINNNEIIAWIARVKIKISNELTPNLMIRSVMMYTTAFLEKHTLVGLKALP